MKPNDESVTATGVGSTAWLASFRDGNWVAGWVIEDPYGERERFSFARTRKEAWQKFCAPALDYPRCVPALRKDGFRAVKMRARQKFAAWVAGKSDLANPMMSHEAGTKPPSKTNP